MLFKILFLFFILTVGSSILIDQFDITFGTSNYWDLHGVFFLLFLATFPRLTLLFSSVASGGFLWWLGWLFTPRLLVAILATISYWESNKVLVIISWLVAWGGESSEKYSVHQTYYRKNRIYTE